MTSVTQILDYLTEAELLAWIERTSAKKRKAIQDEALRVGSICDRLVQQDINEGQYIIEGNDKPVINCMRAWEKFKTDNAWFVACISSLQMELTKDDVVGHPDFALNTPRGIGIVDLKCATAIRPRYWTQVCQYLRMYTDSPNTFVGILRLDKTREDGYYEYKEITDQAYIRYEHDIFDAYLLAYKHNESNREHMRQILEEELTNATT